VEGGGEIGVFAFADLVLKRDQMKEERVNLNCKFLTSPEITRPEAVFLSRSQEIESG
jgi:hypothetical protein